MLTKYNLLGVSNVFKFSIQFKEFKKWNTFLQGSSGQTFSISFFKNLAPILFEDQAVLPNFCNILNHK